MGFFKKKSESFTSNPNTGKNCCTTGDSVDGFTSIVIDLTDVNAIRNIGTTPIEILPAPGSGKYYEYEGVVEYTYNNMLYNFNEMVGVLGENSYAGTYILPSNVLYTGDKVMQISSKSPVYIDAIRTDTLFQQPATTNERIIFTTWSPVNATTGDGTFKIKLKYRILSFG